MSNPIGDIFGGAKDILFGKGSTQEVGQYPTMSPEQQALLRKLLGELGGPTGGAAAPLTGKAGIFQRMLGGTATPSSSLDTGQSIADRGVTPYTGDMVAGLSGLEGLSLDALEQRILAQATPDKVGASTLGGSSEALAKMIQTGGAPVDFENYFKTAIGDPAMRDFAETILPDLTRRFGSSGAFGSDRLLAEQQATERLNKALLGSRGELAYKTQSDAANRVLGALGLAPQYEQADIARERAVTERGTADIDALIKSMTAASLPRQVEQAKLTANYSEFQRQQEEKKTRLNQVLAALGLQPTQNVPLTTGANPGIFAPIQTQIGVGGSSGFFGK